MVKKGRQAKGEKNGRSKLSYQEVLIIRHLGKEGMNPNEISNMFPVRPSQIRGILKEEYWKLPLAE
jgi:hypothetical protein